MPPYQTKRWTVREPIPSEASAALAAYPPLFRQVLFNRGVTSPESADSYLNARPLPSNPFNLLDMYEAVERILWAADNREKVAVYGDYDVDGVTATALLYEVLQAYQVDVQIHIPNRFEEGYGLNNEALTQLAKEGVDLVITVDCGIRSPLEAEHASGLGIDLIISDHHHPGPQLPLAKAVICPKRDGDAYPDKDLSGVGLAYKIAQALMEKRPLPNKKTEDWLDLVALGTVADVVPLRGENRALVRAGLEKLRQGRRQGVVSLAGAAGVKLHILSAGDIGFMLGPRLNAAGRLESAMAALDLLLAEDVEAAGRLAQNLDNQNRERQKQTRELQEKATELAQKLAGADILFAFSEEFKSGIVGLAASRLVETFYRPAIVGAIEGETARASCRSIPEFHITHALDECKDLLVRHGGHSVAAGFTVRTEHLPELQRRLAELAAEQLNGKELVPTLRADAEVDLRQMSMNEAAQLLQQLEFLQPTGQENPEATFISRRLRVVGARAVGADKQHLKISVNDGRITWDAIAFRQGKWVDEMPAAVDLFYSFERNEFNGVVTTQLNVRDLKPAS